jgi:hypothetical protein
MNANLTPGMLSGIQLLTWARFADLGGAKFFRSARLVPAVRLELTT